jgi:ubiquinone/menaquinone biosynthesis C-methylase UbiE
MQIDEYAKLDELEESMWYFKALHSRMLLPLSDWKNRTAHVLDAGCGTGGLILAMKEYSASWRLTGLDLSPVACNLARRKTRAEIVEGSITNLPFDRNSFDILTSADVIAHVDDSSIALREFARVLRPGGIAVINVPAYQWMWSYHDDAVQTRHRFRRSELRMMIQNVGLEPLSNSYANTLIFPLIIARRKLFPPPSSSSDVQASAYLVERFCAELAQFEYRCLKRGLSFPIGCSVFISARKP